MTERRKKECTGTQPQTSRIHLHHPVQHLQKPLFSVKKQSDQGSFVLQVLPYNRLSEQLQTLEPGREHGR